MKEVAAQGTCPMRRMQGKEFEASMQQGDFCLTYRRSFPEMH